MEVKNLKPEREEIKPADPLQEGQRILANMIASAYLRIKKDGHTESQIDCITKAIVVKK